MDADRDDLYIQYRAVNVTERERARLETLIWEATSPVERRACLPKGRGQSEFIAARFNVSRYVVAARQYLHLAGDQANILWDCIEKEKLPLTTARTLLRKARSMETSSHSVQEIIPDLIKEYKKLDVYYNSVTGCIHRRQKPAGNMERKAEVKTSKKEESIHDMWRELRKVIGKLITSQLVDVDANMADLLRSELEGELRSLIDSYGPKIKRAKGLGSLDGIRKKISRAGLLEACATLVMNPPKPGREVDLVMAKQRYKKRAARLHPDVLGGHEETRPEWHAVNEAYQYVIKYNEQLKEEKESK